MQEDRLLETIFIGIEEYISLFCIYPLIVSSPHHGGAQYSTLMK